MCFQNKVSLFHYPDLGFTRTINTVQDNSRYRIIKYPLVLCNCIYEIFANLSKILLGFGLIFMTNRCIQLLNFCINEAPKEKKLLISPLEPDPKEFQRYFKNT